MDLKTLISLIFLSASFCFIVFAPATPAFGAEGFSLQLSPSIAPGNVRTRLESFLRAVEQKVPPSIRNTLAYSLPIEFFALDDEGFARMLEKKNCLNVKFAQVNSLPGLARGVRLNQGFISEILNGEAGSQRITCVHSTTYKLAEASLLHEIAHLYDFKIELPYKEKIDFYTDCQSSPAGKRAQAICQSGKHRQGSFSEALSFLRVAGFSSPARALNQKVTRSPDGQELQNTAEFFANNFELFILDPEFKCRRPALYAYFQSQLDFTPSLPACNFNDEIFLSDYSRFKLQADRLNAVKLAIAGPGKEIQSRWGHVYLKLEFCPPGVELNHPKCSEKNSPYHIAIDFYAGGGDHAMSYWKGLTGGYTSELSVAPYSKIFQDITFSDSRSLEEWELNFNRAEIQTFVSRLLEVYWSYASDFKFSDNNCASQIGDLVATALPRGHQIHRLVSGSFSIFSPTDLLQVLRTAEIITQEVTHHASFFAKLKKNYNALFESALTELGFKYSLEEYLNLTSIKDRTLVITALAKTQKPSFDRPTVARILSTVELFLEPALEGVITEAASEAKGLQNFDMDSMVHPDDRLIRNNFIIDRGYGIPLLGQLKNNDVIAQMLEHNVSVRTEFTEKIFNGVDRSEIEQVEHNLRMLSNILGK